MHIHSLMAAGFVSLQFHNLAGPFETLRAVTIYSSKETVGSVYN